MRRQLVPLRAFVEKWIEDDVLDRAAALSFFSVLSLVPMAALVFAALPELGSQQSPEAAAKVIAELYFPQSTSSTVSRVAQTIGSAREHGIGWIAALILVPTASAVIRSAERSLSRIMREELRTGVGRLATHLAIGIGLPLVAAGLIAYGPRFESFWLEHYVVPWLVTSIILWSSYRFLPRRVRGHASAVTASVASLLLLLLKAGFGFYASQAIAHLSVAWGALTFVPILLSWIFASWLVVLTAAVVASLILNWKLRDVGQFADTSQM